MYFVQVSNRKVPKEILLSLSHLTRFLSDKSDDKDEEEMLDVDAVSRFNEERRKSLIILKSPLSSSTTTTTTTSSHDDLFSKDDFDYEAEGFDYHQYDQFEKADENFRFSFKQQQVQPPEFGSTRFEPTTTTATTSTMRQETTTTTAVFVDTPFRLKLDPVSGLFKTVKDFR